MLRLVFPILVLFAAAFVAWQNLDGDGEYMLLPYVEVLPFVPDTYAARGLATASILAGLGWVSLVAQALSWRRARQKERLDHARMREADALREWRESNPWGADLMVGEASSADGGTRALGD